MEKIISFLNGTTYMSGHGVTGTLKNWEALACMGSALMFVGIIIVTAYVLKSVKVRSLKTVNA